MAAVDRLLRRARSTGLVVDLDGTDTVVVRGPRRLEALAHELLAHKSRLLVQLRNEHDPELGHIFRCFPGARVLSDAQADAICRGDTWTWPQAPSLVAILQATARPDIPCPTCRAEQWRRGAAMWVCDRCHPAVQPAS